MDEADLNAVCRYEKIHICTIAVFIELLSRDMYIYFLLDGGHGGTIFASNILNENPFGHLVLILSKRSAVHPFIYTIFGISIKFHPQKLWLYTAIFKILQSLNTKMFFLPFALSSIIIKMT